jgi:DNA polymerase III subunit epsilon
MPPRLVPGCATRASHRKAMDAPLAELDVLVVDCQATGATPAHGSLLELGWMVSRACDEAPVEPRSHVLALPEGTWIPAQITRLTGIDRSDLAHAVEVESAWRALRDAAATVGERVPTVIHFARFETAFLEDLQRRFDPGSPLPFEVVCTHEIARRLLPGLPRRSLRALAGYFGFNPELLRRSAGHVAATAFVWRHLVAALAELGVRRWGDLGAWLADTPASRPPRAFPLARERRLELPDAPGVYKLLRVGGDVLYVGKATSLKKRVSSHFKGGRRIRGTTERALEMLSQVRDLEVLPTETALEAALLETEEIKRCAPPYNVQLLDGERSVWFASSDLAAAQPQADDRHRLGPLPSRVALGSLLALASAIGGPPNQYERARAVAIAPAWGPDAGVFAAGLDIFLARHFPAPPRDPLRALCVLGTELWPTHTEEERTTDDGAPEWDPPRVVRRMERVVVQVMQILRRGRWLCLLADATVAFRERGARRRRLLVVERTAVVERDWLGPDAALPVPAARCLAERRAAFDIGAYDRLRILSTELRRVLSESGVAAARLGPRTVLSGEKLARLLAWT